MVASSALHISIAPSRVRVHGVFQEYYESSNSGLHIQCGHESSGSEGAKFTMLSLLHRSVTYWSIVSPGYWVLLCLSHATFLRGA